MIITKAKVKPNAANKYLKQIANWLLKTPLEVVINIEQYSSQMLKICRHQFFQTTYVVCTPPNPNYFSISKWKYNGKHNHQQNLSYLYSIHATYPCVCLATKLDKRCLGCYPETEGYQRGCYTAAFSTAYLGDFEMAFKGIIATFLTLVCPT